MITLKRADITKGKSENHFSIYLFSLLIGQSSILEFDGTPGLYQIHRWRIWSVSKRQIEDIVEQRKTTLIYTNIICFFSFNYPKCTDVLREEYKTAERQTRRGRRYWSSMNRFPLCSPFQGESSLVIYSGWPHKFSRGHLFQPAAYTLHVDTPPSSIKPTQ